MWGKLKKQIKKKEREEKTKFCSKKTKNNENCCL